MLGKTPSSDNPNQKQHQHHAGTMSPPPQSMLEEIAPAGLPVAGGASKVSPVPTVWQVQWGAAAWLIALHVGALYAPWSFTWSGLALAVLLHWMTGSLGICLGFHRLLTHTGLVVPNWLRNIFTTIGTLAGEGGPIDWTANHRKHHAYSDQPGDPHSPHDGPWWAHAFWLAFSTHNGDPKGYAKKWGSRFAQRQIHSLLERLLPTNPYRVWCIGHRRRLPHRWSGFGCLVASLGDLRSNGCRDAHHLVCELRIAHVGIQELRNA